MQKQIQSQFNNQSNEQLSTTIPFIYLENDKFMISKQAQSFLKSIKNPVAIFTIVGKYRTGKSLFLNKILLNRPKAFKVSPTINSCTKGLWLWKDTIKVQNNKNTIEKEILIIDTQGFGATEETDAYNNKILLFSLLLSSFFVYNSVGSIDENSLNNISVIANLANQIQSKNSKDQNIDQYFPSFLWLVRDFTLNLVDKNDFPIKPNQYLEQALQLQKGTSNQIQSKNRIRRMIKHFFKDRDCFTLVRPVQTQDKLQQLDTLNQSQFRQTFLQQSKVLRQKILSKIKVKKIKNTPLNGQSLFQIAQNYTEVINNNSLPNFQNSFKHLVKLQITKFKRKFIAQYEGKIMSFFGEQFKSIQSFEQYQKFKKEYLQSLQKSIKSGINQNSSLNFSLSSEQSSQILVQITTQLTQKFLKKQVQTKQRIKSLFIKQRQKLMQDNQSQDFQQMSQKQFKHFISQILQSKYQKTIIQPIQRSYGKAFTQYISQLQTSQWQPYIHQLKQQHKQISFKKLSQNYQQTRTKLQLKEQQIRSQRELIQNYEKQNKKQIVEITELTMKNQTLNKELEGLKQYSKKQEQELNQDIGRLEYKVEEIKAEKIKLIKQLEIKNKQISEMSEENRVLKEMYNLVDKQLGIFKQRLETKENLLREKQEKIDIMNEEIDKQYKKIQMMQQKLEEVRQSKQQLYKKFLSQSQNYSQKILQLQKQSTKQVSQLKQLKKYIQHKQSQSKQKLQQLGLLYRKQQINSKQLLQMNNKLIQLLKGFDQTVKQFYVKQCKYKQYKKCIKNSSSIQCLHCSRFFMVSVFHTHLELCTSFKENQDNKVIGKQAKSNQENNRIRFKITNVKVNQSNGKPCTIYQIQCRTKINSSPSKPYNNNSLVQEQKTWIIQKKFTQICQFNKNLQASLPHLELPSQKIIFDTKYLTQKSISLDEKKNLIEKYLNQLANINAVVNNKYWVQFVGISSFTNENSQSQKQNSLKFQSRNYNNLSTPNLLSKTLNYQSRQPMGELSMNTNSKLNYQMKKSFCAGNNTNKQSQKQKTKGSTSYHQSLKKQSLSSVQTPEQFFKIWQQKQLKNKSSTLSIK